MSNVSYNLRTKNGVDIKLQTITDYEKVDLLLWKNSKRTAYSNMNVRCGEIIGDGSKTGAGKRIKFQSPFHYDSFSCLLFSDKMYIHQKVFCTCFE